MSFGKALVFWKYTELCGRMLSPRFPAGKILIKTGGLLRNTRHSVALRSTMALVVLRLDDHLMDLLEQHAIADVVSQIRTYLASNSDCRNSKRHMAEDPIMHHLGTEWQSSDRGRGRGCRDRDCYRYVKGTKWHCHGAGQSSARR